MSKFSTLFAVFFLSFCALPALSLAFCNVNLNNDLNDRHPLLLRQNSEDFFYPKKCNSNRMKLRFCETIRAVCPQDSLEVNNRNLNRAEANLKCYAANFFRVAGTFYGAPLRNIACASAATATLTNTGVSCPNGVLGRIGFQLQNNRWASTVERICHDEARGQTHWAHHRVPGSLRSRQTNSSAPAFATGPFYGNISMDPSIFTRDSQRARLLALLNDQARVDQIIPPASSNILEPGMLVPAGDMFYREQQNSVFYYANSVPVWTSIRDGNRRQVEDAVRGMARSACRTLDVYSGAMGALTYSDSAGTTTADFTLTTSNAMTNSMPAVPVPRYLFKYVVDRSRSQGLVFVTVNDPTVSSPPPAADILCPEFAQCASRFPEFRTAARGYTYCCANIQGSEFATRAMSLGIPIVSSARPLSLAGNEDPANPWNPLLGAFLPNAILDSINSIAANNPFSSTARPGLFGFGADDDDFDY